LPPKIGKLSCQRLISELIKANFFRKAQESGSKTRSIKPLPLGHILLTSSNSVAIRPQALTNGLKYETYQTNVIVPLKQCQIEIEEFPLAVREELADALARLDEGHTLSMPLSRPMPSIGRGVHELRFRDRAGIYRVIYVFLGSGRIVLLHAFTKKTPKTPQQHIELAQRRLKGVR
jgi:phage-related protein